MACGSKQYGQKRKLKSAHQFSIAAEEPKNLPFHSIVLAFFNGKNNNDAIIVRNNAMLSVNST